MKKNESKLDKLHGNLVGFVRDFIIAGPRNNQLNFFNKLAELGAEIDDSAIIPTLASKKQIVILCRMRDKPNGKSYCSVEVMSWAWWNYWHNPRHCYATVLFKTYNALAQQQKIIDNLIIEPIPEVTPIVERNSLFD